MKNNEDSSETVRKDNNCDFLQDASQITKSNWEPESFESVNNFETLKHELSEIPVTPKNTAYTMVSEVNPEIPSKMEKAESISELESKYYELQARLEFAEDQHVRDQAEIDRLNNHIESQTAFTLNVGAVMGNLVWRASYEPKVISQWFTKESYKKTVEEFVSIADRIIETFLKMYEEELPPYSTDEYQFVRGLLGTVVNMATICEGREFLIENKDSKSLLRNVVFFLPRIPMPLGVHLKRLLMVILWNMSVNKFVLNYFFDLQIGKVVAHCIDESNPEILRLLGFELLLSITYNLTDPRLLDDILKYVSIEYIHRIADTRQDKVGTLAQRFLDHFTSSENVTSKPNTRS